MRKLSIEELNRINVEMFKKAEKMNFRVILDNIRSQFNIGSIFRTCDAFRAESLWLCGICACPPGREIEKSALGATRSVSWQYFKTSEEAVKKSKEEGYIIVAVEQTTKSIDIRSFVYDRNKKYAFVFGNEIAGVSNEILSYCDYSIEIPQFGTKHSFNVAITCGIILYDYFFKVGK